MDEVSRTPRCASILGHPVDTHAVQIKLDGEKLIVYCPYQQYVVTGQERLNCPEKPFELPLNSDLKIYRHVNRNESGVLFSFKYNSSMSQATTLFDMPEKLRLIEPKPIEDKTIRDALATSRKVIKDEIQKGQNFTRPTEYVELIHNKVQRSSWIATTFRIVMGVIIVVIVGSCAIWLYNRCCIYPRAPHSLIQHHDVVEMPIMTEHTQRRAIRAIENDAPNYSLRFIDSSTGRAHHPQQQSY